MTLLSKKPTSSAMIEPSFPISSDLVLAKISHNGQVNPDQTFTITVRLSDLLDDAEIAALEAREARFRQHPPSVSGLGNLIDSVSKLRQRRKSKGYEHEPERSMKISMTVAEYLSYWARDADSGQYRGTEPEGQGREIWRKRLWPELGLMQYAPDVSKWTGGNARPAGAIAGTPGVPWFLKKNRGEGEGFDASTMSTYG